MEKIEIMGLTIGYFLFDRVDQKERCQGGVKKALIDVMVELYTTLQIPWNNPVVPWAGAVISEQMQTGIAALG